MDIKDVIEYREKKILLPQGLVCPKWEGVIDIITAVRLYELYKHLGKERFNPYTPFHYLLKNCAFKLYAQGNSAADVSSLFDIPVSTAHDLHELYLKHL